MHKDFKVLSVLLILLAGFSLSLQAAGDERPAANRPVILSIAPQSAVAGERVAIEGMNFGRRKGGVRFGGRKAKILTWSDRLIEARVPRGGRSVAVRVINKKHKSSAKWTFGYGGGDGGGGGGGGGGLTAFSDFKVLANNDLGMHCVDKDFSVFSILPPYNVVNAQVIGIDRKTGRPSLLGSDAVTLRYSPVADASGSSNSRSRDKSNFWQWAPQLFGVDLAPGQGLRGLYMPADAPAPDRTQFSWNAGLGLFAAEGIPILPFDDAGRTNRYPLMRVTAYDKSGGRELGHTDVVLPVSEETTCSNCHATGKEAAEGGGWSADPDLEVQSRENILTLHDREESTHLQASKPVLCASCHYSRALDLDGRGPNAEQSLLHSLSRSMHEFHAGHMNGPDGRQLFDKPVLQGDPLPSPDQQSCYQCHPGKDTKCLRGAMTEARIDPATGRPNNPLVCQNCHGDMRAVGGVENLRVYSAGATDAWTFGDHPRRHWEDEPRCESCHSGDALSHLVPANARTMSSDGLRLLLGHDPSDSAASPFIASNRRFAEDHGKLFRFSKAPTGVACEGCHGSTHALWPANETSNPNDNVAATQIQGHAGVLTECVACHKEGSLPLTLDGPHGMHNVNDRRWNEDHEDFYERDPAECKACHGRDLRGTVLSRAAADRVFLTKWGTKKVKKGEVIGCYTCHNGPDDD